MDHTAVSESIIRELKFYRQHKKAIFWERWSLIKQHELIADLSEDRRTEYARWHICRGRDKEKFVLYDLGGPERGLVAATSKNHIGAEIMQCRRDSPECSNR